MRILYQSVLSPFCRKIRIVLEEKNLEYYTISKDADRDREDIYALTPSGELPVLMEDDSLVLSHHQAIGEYLDESFDIPNLMGKVVETRAEVRRLCHWFDGNLYADAVKYLLSEKVYKRLSSLSPNSKFIAVARDNLDAHMQYISRLAEKYEFLVGDFFSMADISAAAQLSVLDYLGEVNWDKYSEVKDWYMKIKSRKSFKPVLAERMKGILPPFYYSNLDF